MANLCILEGKIAQGSPSSGAISNIVMSDFDEELFARARKSKLRYTRYSDDITFSGTLEGFGSIGELTEQVSLTAQKYGQKLNRGKTRLLGRHNRQSVTGIVVNEKLDVARHVRKAIRQEVYYVRKYGLLGHAERKGDKSPIRRLERLIGILAHIIFVRPDDLFAIKAKNELVALRREILDGDTRYQLAEHRRISPQI